MPIEVRSLAEWEAAGIERMLSVVIPAHNEEGLIAETVREVAAALKAAAIPYEIIVVNDNSTDGTESILAILSRENPAMRYINNVPPNGFGFAVRRGLAEFRGSAVAIVMADGSDDPADIVRFYRALEQGYECVFGSRFIQGSQIIGYPRPKLLMNRLANLLIRALFMLRYNDVTNAFKMYRRSAIAGIQPLLSHHFNLHGRAAAEMHHPRLPLYGAAEFLEGPQERRLQAPHQGDGVALFVHYSVLLARAHPVARGLSRPASLQCQPAAGVAPLVVRTEHLAPGYPHPLPPGLDPGVGTLSRNAGEG